MRAIAWVYKQQNIKAKILFTGCVGDDEFGSIMAKRAADDGVTANYSIEETVPTGTCAVCLTDGGRNRSLCAYLGASQMFSDHHIRDNWDQLVKDTDIIYITGFLMKRESDGTFHVLGEHVAKSDNPNKKFCLNLSARYVSEMFGSKLDEVIKYTDIIFGNDDEALAFAEFKKWSTQNIDEIATKLAQEPKLRKQVGRLVVFTQGDRPTIVAQSDKDGKVEVTHYPVKPIPDNEMVDTNGAGDAFAGGFVSQFALGAPIKKCVKVGDLTAREVIKVDGISFDSKLDINSGDSN